MRRAASPRTAASHCFAGNVKYHENCRLHSLADSNTDAWGTHGEDRSPGRTPAPQSRVRRRRQVARVAGRPPSGARTNTARVAHGAHGGKPTRRRSGGVQRAQQRMQTWHVTSCGTRRRSGRWRGAGHAAPPPAAALSLLSLGKGVRWVGGADMGRRDSTLSRGGGGGSSSSSSSRSVGGGRQRWQQRYFNGRHSRRHLSGSNAPAAPPTCDLVVFSTKRGRSGMWWNWRSCTSCARKQAEYQARNGASHVAGGGGGGCESAKWCSAHIMHSDRQHSTAHCCCIRPSQPFLTPPPVQSHETSAGSPWASNVID